LEGPWLRVNRTAGLALFARDITPAILTGAAIRHRMVLGGVARHVEQDVHDLSRDTEGRQLHNLTCRDLFFDGIDLRYRCYARGKLRAGKRR
jgi:hypothetical protein